MSCWSVLYYMAVWWPLPLCMESLALSPAVGRGSGVSMGTTFCILCSQFPLLPSFLLFWITSQQQGPNFLANENHKVLSLALRGSSVVEDLPRRYEILDLTSSPTNTHSLACTCVYTHTPLPLRFTRVANGWLDLTPCVRQGTVGPLPADPIPFMRQNRWGSLLTQIPPQENQPVVGQVGIFISNWHPGHPTQKAL